MNRQEFDEKQRLTDLLDSQKFVTGVYNTFCCEAATPDVKTCLSGILQDEHRIQESVFDSMNRMGFYTLEKAEDTKINAAKAKYGQQN